MRCLLLCLVLLICPTLARAETAIFAGGNFWILQAEFDAVPGVTGTVAGYTGGSLANPSYKQVRQGGTGHREALVVSYDPKKISYPALLDQYWRHVDPVDATGQFCNKGPQYTTAIYYMNDDQKRAAMDSKMLLEADSERMGASSIATQIIRAGIFYPAEDYHQGYYRKNALRYRFYRDRCGIDRRLADLWGKP